MMSIEHINLKFLVRQGKTPTEALKLFQELYGDKTMSRTRLLRGIGDSKKKERMWKMIPEVGGYPQAEQMKMLSA